MDIRDGVESVFTISFSAEITLKELVSGGAQMFANRLRERLEEELHLVLGVPWDRVGVAPQSEPATANVTAANEETSA